MATLPLWMDPGAQPFGLQRWLLNAVPLLVLWLIALLLSARPLFAGLLIACLAGTFYLVHAVKSAQLALPLLPSDLLMAGHLLTSPELYLRYLNAWQLLLAGSLLLALLWLLRRERPLQRPRLLLRLPGAALLAGTAAAICSPLAHSWSPYSADQLRATVWDPSRAARELGAVALFIKMIPNTHRGLPEPDLQRLNAFRAARSAELDALASDPLPEPLPDLVVVQSESFFDPRRLRQLDALPALRAFDRLAARSDHGLLQIPTYGGLTTRTEFEFLTGFPLQSLPGVSYPFQGLVHRPMHSLAWSLRTIGYQALAVHPYEPRFYQRDRVYPLLGFEAFHDHSSFHGVERDGYYLPDAAVLAHLRGLLERPGPQFVFAVTMENHGPWDAGRHAADLLDTASLPAELDDDDRLALAQFLHHLDNADRTLDEFARWVQQRDEPTVLLFYGDHLPALDGVYKTLGFSDDRPAHVQPTPWLLMDNRSAASDRRDLGSHQLAGALLARAGLHHDRFFNAVQLSARYAPADQDTHRALAAERLAQPLPATLQAGPAEAQFATVLDWGPGDLEARYPEDDLAPTFWLRSQQPLGAGTALALGKHRLQVVHRADNLLYARARQHHFGLPGERLPLRLIGDGGQRAQTVGDVALLPPADRVLDAEGQPSRFCAVEDWGPRESAAEAPANPQPNGNMGLWLRAACLPPAVRLEVAGELLDSYPQGRLVTASVALGPLRGQQRLPVALVDADRGQRLPVGEITLTGSH